MIKNQDSIFYHENFENNNFYIWKKIQKFGRIDLKQSLYTIPKQSLNNFENFKKMTFYPMIGQTPCHGVKL